MQYNPNQPGGNTHAEIVTHAFGGVTFTIVFVAAEICFDIADQDAITVPDELRFALDADDDAAAAWMKLTTGKRRGFAYRVASAKMPETRERRAQEIIELLGL